MKPKQAEPADDPLKWVGAFEKELSLPRGFFVNLMHKEDDWSFIIKLHALVDAAISHLLATKCGDELLRVFARLGMNTKLPFAKALDVLDAREQAFVRKLSEIRNAFAHDVRQAGTTLAAYVVGLDTNQLNDLKVGVGPATDPFPIVEPPVPALEFVRDNPKLCIWLRALLLIAWVYQQKDLAMVERKLVAERERLAQTVLELGRLEQRLGSRGPTAS